MAALSIKSIFLWFSNILIPFVLVLNMQGTVKDSIRERVEIFTSNAKLLYFFLLAGWVTFNLCLLWIKYQKEQEILRKVKIERQIKELELKNKQDEFSKD